MNSVGIILSGIPSPESETDISIKLELFGTVFALTLINPALVYFNALNNKLTRIYMNLSGSEYKLLIGNYLSISIYNSSDFSLANYSITLTASLILSSKLNSFRLSYNYPFLSSLKSRESFNLYVTYCVLVYILLIILYDNVSLLNLAKAYSLKL